MDKEQEQLLARGIKRHEHSQWQTWIKREQGLKNAQNPSYFF